MYALQKRKAEWELKNEILLAHLKARAAAVLHAIASVVASGLSFGLFVLFKTVKVALRAAGAIMKPVKFVRLIAPEVEPEEVQHPPVRLFEQGPMVR